MCSKPEYLSPQATLKEAAVKMRSHGYGFVPIGENDRLVGAITDRDITIRAVAEGKDPNKTTLSHFMTKGIQYCFEDDNVEEAVHKMEDLKIKRLVVLNNKKDKRLTGVIAFGDVASKCHNFELAGHLAEAISEH
jgi:CBS domain-containing protein